MEHGGRHEREKRAGAEHARGEMGREPAGRRTGTNDLVLAPRDGSEPCSRFADRIDAGTGATIAISYDRPIRSPIDGGREVGGRGGDNETFAGSIAVSPPLVERAGERNGPTGSVVPEAESWNGNRNRNPADGDGAPDGPSSDDPIETDPETARVETVETVVTSARDLVGLWITIGCYIDEAAARGERAAVCFDSLTALLGYVSVDRVLGFVRLLLAQLREANAVSHFHLDPEAHDRETVASLQSLFDVTTGTASLTSVGKRAESPERTGTTDLAAITTPERRRVVETLLAAGGRATIEELSTQVARAGAAGSVETARLVLHHSHLPRLAESGVIEFDPRVACVRLVSSIEELGRRGFDPGGES